MGRPNCLPIFRPSERSVVTNLAFEISPRTEARALLPLLKLPRESIATVRKLIAISEIEEQELRRDEIHAGQIVRFRRACLRCFDILVGLEKPDPEPAPEVKVRKRKFDHAAICAAVRNGEPTIEIA